VDDVVSLNVSPARMTLVGPPGTKMGLVAELKDSKGNPANFRPKWVSGDAKVATVDPDGVVTSGGEGRTTVIASLGNDLSSASDVRVLHREISTFEVTPHTLILKVGETQRLNVTVKDASGLQIEDAALAWASSDPKTATVSNGAVTGVARGSAVITVATSSRTLSATAIVD
ncbi:MAG TPA: Ig-like domain-containing protein, partial [Thermoanaerobaculia bacterium]|nr:Ig-like domain-containing protein [Thermoanaerobaculia bacterium]